MEQNSNQIISAYEACSILGIPLSSLYYLSDKGKIKAIKVGRRWRYKREDIKHYNSFGTSRAPARQKITINKKKERRNYQRINCLVGCILRINLPYKLSDCLSGTIQNISAGGFFMNVQNNTILRIDDPVKIEFNLDCPDGTENIEALGRIVRIEGANIAVKYRYISEGIKEKLIRYVG